MNKLILGSKFSRITAKKIAQTLNADYAEQLINANVTYSFIFRYGNSFTNLPVLENNNVRVVINTTSSINRVCDKVIAREIMINENIKCPKIITQTTLDATKYQLIARPRVHWRGQHFIVINDKQQAIKYLNKGYYLQELINKTIEYRIFMWNRTFFEVNEKVNNNNATGRSLLIRNHDNGWFFKKIPYQSLNPLLLEYCRRICEIFSITWCAIDACIDDYGKPYIFEINSAPSLNQRKIEKLCAKIRILLQHSEISTIDNERI